MNDSPKNFKTTLAVRLPRQPDVVVPGFGQSAEPKVTWAAAFAVAAAVAVTPTMIGSPPSTIASRDASAVALTVATALPQPLTVKQLVLLQKLRSPPAVTVVPI